MKCKKIKTRNGYALPLSILDKIYVNCLYKKRWINISEYCNGNRHPFGFHYRPYRKGKERCYVCGAKIGKIKCVMKSHSDMMIDNIFKPSIMFDKFGIKDINFKDKGDYHEHSRTKNARSFL